MVASATIFADQQSRRGLTLDPRSKLLLTIVLAIIVLGGLGGTDMRWIRAVLSAIPLVLLLASGRFVAGAVYAGAYAATAWLQFSLIDQGAHGTLTFLLLIASGIFTRILPGILAAYYLVTTTTVSEFMASMHRMRMPNSVAIPLSVMFRFFPTVIQEASAIQRVMKMRGIRVGASPMRVLEYRLVPVLICSARIGEELSAAALTRGLGAPIKRTNMCDVRLRVQDWIVIGLCLGACVAAVAFSITG